MKNLIYFLIFFAIPTIAQKSETAKSENSELVFIQKFKSKVFKEKIINTKIGCRTRIAASAFEIEKGYRYADVRRFKIVDGKLTKAGFSKNKLFGGLGFTPTSEGKYFIIVRFETETKNRVLEIDVYESHFDIVVFRKTAKAKKANLDQSRKVKKIKKSLLPDFDDFQVSKLDDFWGCEMRKQRFVKMSNIKNHLDGILEVTYFYQKSETDFLTRIFEPLRIEKGEIGLHVPFEGIYFAIVEGEKGKYYFKLIATDSEGVAFELFEKKIK